jgi:hypothetical protein
MPTKTHAVIGQRIKGMEELLAEAECRGFAMPNRRFGLWVAGGMCTAESEEHMMILFGWINLAFGLLAAFAGVIVLRGVFRRMLSSASTVRFEVEPGCEPGGAHAPDPSSYAGTTDLHGLGVLHRNSDHCLA